MIKWILIAIFIVTGGSVVHPKIRKYLERKKQFRPVATIFAVVGGILAAIEMVVWTETISGWISRTVGPSEESVVQSAIQDCNVNLDWQCMRRGAVFGADGALVRLKSCKNPEMLRSDHPSLQWKDIWTTSVYSYQPGGPGPGGGRDDDVLKVGGWGDWYFSLIQFELPTLQRQPGFAAVILYSKETEGASVPLMLDQLVHPWSFPKGGTLWWKDRPGQRAAVTEPLPAPKRERWYLIEITDLFQNWSNRKIKNYGFQLRPAHEFGSFVFFASSDATDKSKIPHLVFCQ